MNYAQFIKRLFPLILGLWFSIVNGQTDCSNLLINANSAYNQGKYEQVITLLNSNIYECNFNKIEREQATKILASALSKIDEVEEAEKLVYNLLKKNPNYVVQTTVDPKPFVSILNKFERSPRSVIGFNVGEYLPFVNIDKNYSIWDAADYSSKYKTESNLSFSLHYQYFITKKLSVSLEPEITSLIFSREINATNMVDISYSEKATLLKIPVLVSYEVFKRNNFSASLSAGIYSSYNWGNQYGFNYQLPDAGLINLNGELNNQRNANNIGYKTGIELAYSKDRLKFSAKIGYSSDFKPYSNSSNRYSSNDLLLDYYYIYDDIIINNLDFKLGVAYTFSYKIKHKYRSK
jgi:Outer membrane protein beta-barrel domain